MKQEILNVKLIADQDCMIRNKITGEIFPMVIVRLFAGEKLEDYEEIGPESIV